MVYLHGASLPRFSWKKRPLNDCSVVVVVIRKFGVIKNEGFWNFVPNSGLEEYCHRTLSITSVVNSQLTNVAG